MDSPGLCGLRPRTLQGSLDSILTFSDYDQDPPEPRQTPSDRRPDPSRDAPTVDVSSALELLSLDRRRQSAPAIAYVTELRPRGAPGGTDGDEEFSDTLGPPREGPAASSSGDSLDSLCSPRGDVPWGLLPSRSPASRLPSAPGTRSSAGELLAPGTQKGSPSKEALSRGPTKGCRGLHPNSCLKKGRRLSLTQPDPVEQEVSGSVSCL